MIRGVHLRKAAQQDLLKAASWYEKRRLGLGHAFLDEVHASLGRLAETPLLYPDLHRNTRRALIQRFPFGVYYRVGYGGVVVIAVMHASRDPRHWKDRT